MKKSLLLLSLIILSASCTNDNSSESPKAIDNESSAKTISTTAPSIVPVYDCDPQVIDINAGQNYLSGNIAIGNSSENLYVTYNANPSWKFTQLHLFVGPLNKVPQKNGNPTPGQFPYKVTFNSKTTTYTFEIPVANIEKDIYGCFVVAAHSNMCKTNANGGVIQTETGWAGYNNFSGNNWARYFSYCLCTTFG